MPASTRFVAALLALGVVAGAASFTTMRLQASAAARVTAEQLTGGRVEHGEAVITRAACGACHTIPGIRAARGTVGPPLQGMAVRKLIAGRFTNSPPVLVRWLRTPQAMVPGSGMPDTGLTEQQARDAAAYLYNLE